MDERGHSHRQAPPSTLSRIGGVVVAALTIAAAVYVLRGVIAGDVEGVERVVRALLALGFIAMGVAVGLLATVPELMRRLLER
jgi:Na+-driven multidrug efflux pump